jgi:methionyl-tRNA formyltransferase
MKYLFFGTPEFAAIVLDKLIKAGMPPAGAVCNPDRPVGRKKIITPPPVKILAQKHGIPVFQPEKLLNTDSYLRNVECDFAVVAAYGKIIPKSVLDVFKSGVIGVHPSLLPKYRGPTPVQTAILNGEKETGVSLFLVDDKVDHGPVLAERKISGVQNMVYPALHDKLAEIGADLLIETIPGFLSGSIKPRIQNEAEATFTKKFETKDAQVDLAEDNPVMIDRKVRALNPEPGVWTLQQVQSKPKRMKILEAELNPPAGGGKLTLKKIQFEGKKPQILR